MPSRQRRLTIDQKRKNSEARRIREGRADPRPNGRPKKKPPADTVETLAQLPAITDKEIALNLGISLSTFYLRMKDDTEFKDAVERGRAKSTTDLRKLIMRHSEGEGTAAVTATGIRVRHELGWHDRPMGDTKHTVDVKIEITSASERIAHKFDQLRERILGSGQSQALPQLEVLGDTEVAADGEFVESGVAGGSVERSDSGVQG